MPDFNPQTALMANSAITEVLPKDEYLLAVFEPKAFSRTFKDKNTTEDVTIIGVRYPVKVNDGPHAGKKAFPEFSLNNDSGLGAFIRFLMAVTGFEPTPTGEAAFKEKYGTLDYNINPDTGHLGDAYRLATGKVVYCTMDSRNTDGKDYQSFKTWRRTNG